MDRGLYVAASGALSQQRVLDTATSNLSNANVSGFKKDFPIFEIGGDDNGDPKGSQVESKPYYSENALIEGSTIVFDDVSPTGTRVKGKSKYSENAFVEGGTLEIDFSQGSLTQTGGKYDFAIKGQGFMVVETEDEKTGESKTLYTRNGNFSLNANGDLITRHGHRVMGENGAIKLNGLHIDVDNRGRIFENGVQIDRLKVVEFDDPDSLKRVGSALYEAGGQSAEAKSAEDIEVYHRHLEQSNAKPIEEMIKMISALRAYETNMKLIGSFDSITEKAITLAK